MHNIVNLYFVMGTSYLSHNIVILFAAGSFSFCGRYSWIDVHG